ncbi:inositol monophosphatase [Nakamurella sp. YIM 132087]|uniref:Inositol-1-monophosphatase n=1 Tax=Nakamurella alba TaxID=2665158 RepID=A0A7K1FPR5_9ACTN|nr:inositol monophosphatase family protein [Nakamurella alba]MTD16136.1 inositol monophosphatase [Nakamurella alba]
MTETPDPAVPTAGGVDPLPLLDLAIRVARAAGAELLRRYGHVEGLDTKSSATDPVSDADRAAEALIVRELLAERPDDGMIGEEGADRPSGTGITWVIDPLDGTVNYLYELDNFSVSIAAEDADGGLVGVVHDPRRDITFTAVRGGGAFLDGTPLQVSAPASLEKVLLSTGFGYSPERRAAQGALVAGLLPSIRDIRRIGSAALDLCAVAAGRIDAFYEEGVQHWDVAAGGLIAREAGALMTPIGLTGAETGWLVAGPDVHTWISAALEDVHRAL